MSRVPHIRDLVRERNAVIIAHYYQRPEVKEVADFIGDSLAMAKYANTADASVIVLAGVRFMAETVALLNPDKEVLLPESEAGCSLAENCHADHFAEFVQAHPGYEVVTYINSSVEVKAMSDVICTSSNAERIINAIPVERSILFAPDKHLGGWLQKRTGRNMVLWDAVCEVHHEFSMQQLRALLNEYPGAQLLAHPECETDVLDHADVVGSTSRLLNHVADRAEGTFIIATEEGILHEMRAAAPFATLIPLPQNTPNACACGECPHMKRTTLESLERALTTRQERVEIAPELRERALRPVRRMLEFSN